MAFFINSPITSSFADPSMAGHLEELGIDAQGRTLRLVQMSTSLTNDTTVDGSLVYRTTTSSTVTNTAASAATINSLPVPAGVALGALAESPSSDTYYAWVLIRGRKTNLLTNGDDDIAQGNCLDTDSGSNGGCNSVSGAITADLLGVLVGRALAADVDAANTVDAMINIL